LDRQRSYAAPGGDKDGPFEDPLLVKVATDQGLAGRGTAFGFQAVTSANLAIYPLIVPLCI
jgi:L-alanine-DL-glutamate epimerase-like enolase superfamily enzyme